MSWFDEKLRKSPETTRATVFSVPYLRDIEVGGVLAPRVSVTDLLLEEAISPNTDLSESKALDAYAYRECSCAYLVADILLLGVGLTKGTSKAQAEANKPQRAGHA